MLKFAFNLIDDGLVGQQIFAGEATLTCIWHRGDQGRARRLPREAPSGVRQASLGLL